MLTADVTHLGQIPLRRKIHPTRTDDRLREERRDLVRTDPLDQLEQTLRIIPADRGRIRHQLAVPLTVHRNTSESRSRNMHSVVRLLTTDDDRLLRLPHLVPVPTSKLRRSVHRIRTTRSEEDLAPGNRRDGRQTLRQHLRGLGNKITEIREMSDLRQLSRHRIRDLRAPVPDIGEPQARRRIQIPSALAVPDVRALTARDDKRAVLLHSAHVREPVPQCRSHRLSLPTGYVRNRSVSSRGVRAEEPARPTGLPARMRRRVGVRPSRLRADR